MQPDLYTLTQSQRRTSGPRRVHDGRNVLRLGRHGLRWMPLPNCQELLPRVQLHALRATAPTNSPLPACTWSWFLNLYHVVFSLQTRNVRHNADYDALTAGLPCSKLPTRHIDHNCPSPVRADTPAVPWYLDLTFQHLATLQCMRARHARLLTLLCSPTSFITFADFC